VTKQIPDFLTRANAALAWLHANGYRRMTWDEALAVLRAAGLEDLLEKLDAIHILSESVAP
jgi:hypothetical protein